MAKIMWRCQECGSKKKGNLANICKTCYYRDTQHKYYLKNRKKKRAYDRKYYLKNRKKLKKATEQYRKEHPDKYREYRKKWAEKNPTDDKISHRKWVINNREAVNSIASRRRAKKKGNGGSHTAEEWIALRNKTKGICPCCKKRVGLKKIIRDHIQAIAKGGSDNINNIQPLCQPCNVKKGTKKIRYRVG